MARAVDSVKTKRLIASAELVCEANGRDRKNGNPASERTFRGHMEVFKNFCRTLHREGLLIENVNGIGEKHINGVFDAWVRKGLKPKTLQGQKSILKTVMGWLKKPGLADYVALIDRRYEEDHPGSFRVKTVAVTSKSERGAGVDFEVVFYRAKLIDERFAAMLLVERFFGLRKKEALLARPHYVMKRGRLLIDGNISKGGRPREIILASGAYGKRQVAVARYACTQCRGDEGLAWPGKSFQQCESIYYRRCKQIGLTKADLGITGHSLRAGFAEDMMLLDRILPPVLGGTKEMSPRDLRQISKARTSESMGHSRIAVTHAYYGQDQRFSKAGALLGYEFADVMTLSEKDKAVLWVSENPVEIPGFPGEYELPGALAELAFITVQILSDGAEVSRMSFEQFLSMYPLAEDALRVRLGNIGLTF